MKFRRVVTGHRADGKAVIASDQIIEGESIPGDSQISLFKLWGADEASIYPDEGAPQPHRTWFPPLGGVRFMAFVLMPNSETTESSASPEEVKAALDERFAGLAETFEPDNPGMHRSATTDMLYVISGRCLLELDDGSETEIGAGDVIVQSGTMHRWKNPFDEPCHVIAVAVGARTK